MDKTEAKMRYWKCSCCDFLIVTNLQDDASKGEYKCSQCLAANCSNPGNFLEISLKLFWNLAIGEEGK